MAEEMIMSTLPKTWILDLDGTIVKHNGYKIDGIDTMLSGAREFIDSIPADDMIIFLTSRTDEYRELTIDFLRINNIRYNEIIFNVPYGERILVNDRKPSGLDMSVAVNVDRDKLVIPKIIRKKN
ncbi:hypothetical protein ACTQ1O_13360 [Bilifractor sp. LCP21S3_A7]|uniref:hypothetical protein n=1 Tax=Bilifractor sp. LCP21S3_A7 TaxID=3438738 RepID=UPI003F92555B